MIKYIFLFIICRILSLKLINNLSFLEKHNLRKFNKNLLCKVAQEIFNFSFFTKIRIQQSQKISGGRFFCLIWFKILLFCNEKISSIMPIIS